MTRIADDDFGCRPAWPMLCPDDELEARSVDNAIELSDFVQTTAQNWASEFRFDRSVILEANRLAMQGIYACAGSFRGGPVTVAEFVPPRAERVPQLVDVMCNYVNEQAQDPIHAAAYLLWRINWIHPFYDGNGRVTREMACLAILLSTGNAEWEGVDTISHLMHKHRDEYYRVLRDADRFPHDEPPRIDAVESFLSSLIVELGEMELGGATAPS